ncbi:hypothetical protein KUTeg_008769 [Tegillarca granosa]|uniref:tRNA wybutosine-synthesizing protein 4 n=1 Tax=Tegillarca granosa TaxID=220873 RepID=A0ABQ9FA01_TEGGR|nr:hypothetical protein KUTeg_008769 [Tegillarca granosa]
MDNQSTQKGRKTCKTRRETAVQGTNDNSIVSKCSMASQGYFNDEFLQHFVYKLTRRAPLIHRGYYIRAKAIDFIIKKFLKENPGKKQMLSLGAGFDSAYFRLKSQQLLNDVTFFEVDFPDVVKRKCQMIKMREALNALIPELLVDKKNRDPLIEIDTTDYKLLGVDLTQLNTLEALLKVCDIDFELPTLLLSECVLTYMTRRCSSAVVKWAAETFCNGLFVMYEQINPNDAFGLFMQNHFQVIGSPLKCINAFPFLESQTERCKKLGWSECEALDMNQFYNYLVPSEERRIIEHLEPFDEYEEWNLKCAHYMILCGYNEIGIPGYDYQDPVTMTAVEFQPMKNETDVCIKRIGHSSTELHSNHIVVTIGGFGEQEGKHKRLTNMTLLDLHTNNTCDMGLDVDDDVEIIRMHHTACVLKDQSLLLIGGRISPLRVCSQLVKIVFRRGTKNESLLQEKNVDVKFNEESVNSTVSTEQTKERENFIISEPQFVHKVTSEEKENAGVLEQCNFQHLCSEIESKCENELKSESKHSKDKKLENPDKPIEIDNVSDSKQFQIENQVKSKHFDDKELVRLEKPIESESSNCDKIWNINDSKPTVICSVMNQHGDIPSPRWRHCAIVFKKNGLEYVFVYGGRTETDLTLKDSYILDIETNHWTEVLPNNLGPGERHSHAVCQWNDLILVSGGLNSDLQPLNSIYAFNTNSYEWTKLEVTGMLHERYSHTAHVIDNYLVLIGGVNLNHSPPGVAIIDLTSNHAMEFPLPPQDKSNLLMLHRHTSLYTGTGKFMIIGGGGNCFSFGTHLNKSPIIMDIRKCLKEVKGHVKI